MRAGASVPAFFLSPDISRPKKVVFLSFRASEAKTRNPGNVIKTGKQAHNGNIAPVGPALDTRFRGYDT